jgi:hypothetical protein
LFFRNAANELVSAHVTGSGATFTVESVQRLYSTGGFLPETVFQASYDVAPDGRHFIMGASSRARGENA